MVYCESQILAHPVRRIVHYHITMGRFFKDILHKVFISKRKEIPFIITISFILSFVITRIWVYLMYQGHLPSMFVYIKGVHVHHLNFGIFLLSVIGFITLVYQDFSKRYVHVLSLIYGIALAWTFDELALWLLLEDDYYHRLSYDAIITISAFLLSIVYFQGFYPWIAKKLRIHKTPHLFRGITGLFRKKSKQTTMDKILK